MRRRDHGKHECRDLTLLSPFFLPLIVLPSLFCVSQQDHKKCRKTNFLFYLSFIHPESLAGRSTNNKSRDLFTPCLILLLYGPQVPQPASRSTEAKLKRAECVVAQENGGSQLITLNNPVTRVSDMSTGRVGLIQTCSSLPQHSMDCGNRNDYL